MNALLKSYREIGIKSIIPKPVDFKLFNQRNFFSTKLDGSFY